MEFANYRLTSDGGIFVRQTMPSPCVERATTVLPFVQRIRRNYEPFRIHVVVGETEDFNDAVRAATKRYGRCSPSNAVGPAARMNCRQACGRPAIVAHNQSALERYRTAALDRTPQTRTRRTRPVLRKTRPLWRWGVNAV